MPIAIYGIDSSFKKYGHIIFHEKEKISTWEQYYIDTID